MDEAITSAVLTLVKTQPGITLANITNQVEQASVDDLNILIATDRIYVDLYTTFLGQAEQVEVFFDQEEAFAHMQMSKISAPVAASNVCAFKITVGTSICWDGIIWQIVNTGDKSIGLIKDDGKFIDLLNETFE